MAKARITVTLEFSERAALMRLADDEGRTDKAQARELLRAALVARGYLPGPVSIPVVEKINSLERTR